MLDLPPGSQGPDSEAFRHTGTPEMKITPEIFKAATGRDPENDDLERCNCTKSGELGHFFCGWNTEKNLPQFMTEPRINSPTYYDRNP